MAFLSHHPAASSSAPPYIPSMDLTLAIPSSAISSQHGEQRVNPQQALLQPALAAHHHHTMGQHHTSQMGGQQMVTMTQQYTTNQANHLYDLTVKNAMQAFQAAALLSQVTQGTAGSNSVEPGTSSAQQHGGKTHPIGVAVAATHMGLLSPRQHANQTSMTPCASSVMHLSNGHSLPSHTLGSNVTVVPPGGASTGFHQPHLTMQSHQSARNPSVHPIQPPQSFPCSKCQNVFISKATLRNHQREHHPPEMPFHCEFCRAGFNDEETTECHTKWLHLSEKERRLECEECSIVESDRKSLILHYQTSHDKDIPFRCNLCEVRFQQRLSLQAHMKTQDHRAREKRSSIPAGIVVLPASLPSPGAYRPPIANAGMFPSVDMGAQVSNQVGADMLSVDESDTAVLAAAALLSTRQNFHNHLKDSPVLKSLRSPPLAPSSSSMGVLVSDDHKFYQCGLCENRYEKKISLAIHNKYVHSDLRPYRCKDCDSAYKDASNLNRHRKEAHGPEAEVRPYSCPQCERRYKRMATLRSHIINAHMRHRPHQCHICKSRFNEREQLVYHVEVLHGKPLGPCNLVIAAPSQAASVNDSSSLLTTASLISSISRA